MLVVPTVNIIIRISDSFFKILKPYADLLNITEDHEKVVLFDIVKFYIQTRQNEKALAYDDSLPVLDF